MVSGDGVALDSVRTKDVDTVQPQDGDAGHGAGGNHLEKQSTNSTPTIASAPERSYSRSRSPSPGHQGQLDVNQNSNETRIMVDPKADASRTFKTIPSQFPSELLLTILSWSLFCLYLGQICLSVWMIIKMKKMPHTFGWKALLFPIGSIYYVSMDSATVGFALLFHIFLSIFAAILILNVLKSSAGKNIEPVELIIAFQAWVTAAVMSISYFLWAHNKSKLRQQMESSLWKVSQSQSNAIWHQNIWNMTQKFGQCCGVDGPLDWGGVTLTSGQRSCYFLGDPEMFEIWNGGCYKVELETMSTYGLILLVINLSTVVLNYVQGHTLICLNDLRLRHNSDQLPNFYERLPETRLTTLPENMTFVQLPSMRLGVTGKVIDPPDTDNQCTLKISDLEGPSTTGGKIENGIEKVILSVGNYGGSCVVAPMYGANFMQIQIIKAEDVG